MLKFNNEKSVNPMLNLGGSLTGRVSNFPKLWGRNDGGGGREEIVY